MKQIKNKLNKINNKIEDIDTRIFGYFFVLIILFIIIIGILSANVALTKELHEQYYIEEECTCNE